MDGGRRDRRRRWRRRIGTIAVVAVLPSSGCGGDDGQSGPGEPVPTTRPAIAFAPVVLLHPRETSFPAAASWFLERSTLKLRQPECTVLDTIATGRVADRKTAEPVPRLDPARLGGDNPYRGRMLDASCRRPDGPAYPVTRHVRPFDSGRPAGLERDEGLYLDLLTGAYHGQRRALAGGHGAGGRVPVYYERDRLQVDGRSELRLRYWLLFSHHEDLGPDSRRLGSHEGDWERIDVLVRRERTGPGRATRYIPLSVRYVGGDAGDRGESLAWTAVEHAGPGATHPVAYSALGSHVLRSRPEATRRRIAIDGRAVTAVDRTAACGDCARWRTWFALRPVRRQPWYGFGGGWGLAYREPVTSGPLGPR